MIGRTDDMQGDKDICSQHYVCISLLLIDSGQHLSDVLGERERALLRGFFRVVIDGTVGLRRGTVMPPPS